MHHPQPHPKSLKYWNIFEILILPEKRAKTERGGPFDNILDPQVKIKYRPLVGHDNKQYFHPSGGVMVQSPNYLGQTTVT